MTCVLFSKKEAEQALGEPLGEPLSGSYAGTTSCGYQPSSDRGVLMSLSRGVSKEDFENAVTQGAELFHQEAQPVAGVGDAAFWLPPYLMVLKTDVFYRLSVWSPQISQPDQLERATELALKMAERIP